MARDVDIGQPSRIHGVDVIDAHQYQAGIDYLIGSYQPFNYYTTAPSAQTMVADRANVSPIYIPRALTTDRIAIDVSTLKAGKQARLAIYNDTDGTPSSLLKDYGLLSVASAVVVEIASDQVWVKGKYWVYIVCEDAAAICGHSQSEVPIFNPRGQVSTNFAFPNNGYKNVVGIGAPADPLPAFTYANAPCYNAWFRIKSLD